MDIIGYKHTHHVQTYLSLGCNSNYVCLALLLAVQYFLSLTLGTLSVCAADQLHHLKRLCCSLNTCLKSAFVLLSIY